MVFSGLTMAWRLAGAPMSRSPVLVKPTTEGHSRPPSAVGITTGSPPSNTATTEFVVPKSIPTTFAIACSLLNLGSIIGYTETALEQVPIF
jgi:hypothetical protein